MLSARISKTFWLIFIKFLLFVVSNKIIIYKFKCIKIVKQPNLQFCYNMLKGLVPKSFPSIAPLSGTLRDRRYATKDEYHYVCAVHV
jgi:hypothetical protein